MIERLPSSHKEAQQLGADRYFTGKPCKKGHIAPRYSWGGCTVCIEEKNSSRDKAEHAAAARARRAANPEPHRESARIARLKDPEKFRAKVRRWRAENPNHVADYNLKYRLANAVTLAEKRKVYREYRAYMERLMRGELPELAP